MGIERYKLISSFCRDKGKYGGAAIYFKEGSEGRLRNDICDLSNTNSFECASTELHLDNIVYLIMCVYCPPKC